MSSLECGLKFQRREVREVRLGYGLFGANFRRTIAKVSKSGSSESVVAQGRQRPLRSDTYKVLFTFIFDTCHGKLFSGGLSGDQQKSRRRPQGPIVHLSIEYQHLFESDYLLYGVVVGFLEFRVHRFPTI